MSEDWGTRLPISGLPKRIEIEGTELYADSLIHIGSGHILRHWQDETETIHIMLHIDVETPDRMIFMFSLNGDVPVEIGQALAEAFMPDSLTTGIQITSQRPGMPSGIVGSNFLGPVESKRIVLN